MFGKVEVLNQLYVAKASLVPKNIDDKTEVLESFLVKPVVKRSIWGRSELLGYVEAITGVRVCDVKYVPDFDYNGDTYGRKSIFVDSESKNKKAGDVNWDIIWQETADKICKEGAIDWYFKHADFDVEGRIKYVREQSKLAKESYKMVLFNSPIRSRVKNK